MRSRRGARSGSEWGATRHSFIPPMRSTLEINEWCVKNFAPIKHVSALALLGGDCHVDIDSFEAAFCEWYGSKVPDGLFERLVWAHCKKPSAKESEEDIDESEEMSSV